MVLIRAGGPVETAMGSLQVSGRREYIPLVPLIGRALPDYLEYSNERVWDANEHYLVTTKGGRTKRKPQVCIVAPHATGGGVFDPYTATLAYETLKRLEKDEPAFSYKILISATQRIELDYNRKLNGKKEALSYGACREKVLKGDASKDVLKEYDKYWSSCAIPAVSGADYGKKRKAYKGFQDEISSADLVMEIHGFSSLEEKDYSSIELGTKSGTRSTELEQVSKRYCGQNSLLMDASVNHIFSGGKTSNKPVSLPDVLEEKPVVLVETSYDARTKRMDDLAEFIAGLTSTLAQELL